MKIWFDRNMGWCVAHVLGILLAVLVVLQIDDFKVINDVMCARNESDCIRDWIGALSGWAAALVGAFTVLLMRRQIQDSQKTNRIRIANELQSLLAVAKKGRMYANELEYFCEYLDPAIISPDNADVVFIATRAKSTVQHIIRLLSDGFLPRFETDIGLKENNRSLAVILASLELANRHLVFDNQTQDERIKPLILSSLETGKEAAMKYAAVVKLSADEFIARNEEYLSQL